MPSARVLGPLLICGTILAPALAAAQAPALAVRDGKPGGTLRMVLREDLPQGFAIHEAATNSVTWPAMPCYSNLVIYDQTKRLALVWQIQKKLEEDAARPTMGWRTDRFAHYPYVRNLILNHVTYNCCRLQEVWLDK